MVEDRQPEVLAIVSSFSVTSFLFVISRIWSRYLGRNFGWDDYLIIVAMVLLIGNTIGTWVYIFLSGTGFHIYDLPRRSVHEQLVMLRWNFSIQMVYHPLLGLIRASIIMFLFRMNDYRRRIRYSLHVVFWLNVLYAIGTTLANLVQCIPVRYVWSKPAMDQIGADGRVVYGGKCLDTRTFVLTCCALSIFMDLTIIPIPTIMVWNLQMSKRTKVLVVAVMSLGWIATGVSMGRFVVYYHRFAPTMKDRTWDIGIGISIAEPAVHIMTACAPATKCLFNRLFPSWGTQESNTGYLEENQATSRAWASKPVNRTRISGGFSDFRFSVSDDPSEPSIIGLDETTGGNHGQARCPSEINLRPLDSIESRDMAEEIGGAPQTIPLEPEPKHCLGYAR